MTAPKINTYHCLCTSLLLATTHTLSTLPRRAPPSLDSAVIIPLPPAPAPAPKPLPPTSRRSPQASEDGADAGDVPESEHDKPEQTELSDRGYTLLLSTVIDRRPTLIRRSDGFERRYLVRCGRCRLVVGYELDDEHYGASAGVGAIRSSEATSAMDVDGDGNNSERMKIMYILPGGVMSTEVMSSGKKIVEKEIVLGEGERTAVVAAWE